jgi:hypothetical protein
MGPTTRVNQGAPRKTIWTRHHTNGRFVHRFAENPEERKHFFSDFKTNESDGQRQAKGLLSPALSS